VTEVGPKVGTSSESVPCKGSQSRGGRQETKGEQLKWQSKSELCEEDRKGLKNKMR
jgi:hypothetical protein